ncbi:hypothetical protein AB0D78_20185 [Streptomyces avermitilis]|uniref:hypothetical protein n=1 Tax=Streptomyces avermitilis TaxID=33903 RepID=UPI0033E5A221
MGLFAGAQVCLGAQESAAQAGDAVVAPGLGVDGVDGVGPGRLGLSGLEAGGE